MDELIITKEKINEFKDYLKLEEKSENTIEKYLRDINAFFSLPIIFVWVYNAFM